MSREVDGRNYKPKKTFKEHMQALHQRMHEYGASLKNKWKNEKKKILINYLIFVLVFIVALTIDQVTKSTLFVWKDRAKFIGDQTPTYEGIILGIRSVEHHGVTLLPWENKATIYFIQVMSIIIFLGLLTTPFLIDSKVMLVLFGFISAGDVGNMLDRFIFEGNVKDILFVPFLEKWQGRQIGTFNFADVFLVSGSVGLIIWFIILIFVEYFQEQKEKMNELNTPKNDENTQNSVSAVNSDAQHSTQAINDKDSDLAVHNDEKNSNS